jgi:hypothetical protein
MKLFSANPRRAPDYGDKDGCKAKGDHERGTKLWGDPVEPKKPTDERGKAQSIFTRVVSRVVKELLHIQSGKGGI